MAALLLFFSANNTCRAQIIDESTPFVAPLPSVGEDGLYDYFAQSFVADVGRVTRIGAWLRADSAQGEVQLAILGNSPANTPDPNFVVYQSALIAPTQAGGWVYDSVPVGAMIPGDIYWLAVDGYATVIGTGYSSVGISTQFPSTNTPMLGSTDGGANWNIAIGNPMAIYVEGDTCSISLTLDYESVVVCPNAPSQLSLPLGFSSYIWSTGATTNTISVTSGGLYSVTVSDANLCLGTASVLMVDGSTPDANLQSSYTICEGNSLYITAYPFYADYLWSTGAVTPAITVDSAGVYIVQVVDLNGCIGSDTTVLVENPSPVVDLGSDTILCEGQFLLLDAGPGMIAYQWSTGASGRSISVNQDGAYQVQVTSPQGCTGLSDTLLVEVQPSPDSPQIALTLAGITSSFSFSYLWLRDGDTLPFSGQTIPDPAPGIYQVVVTNGYGCSMASDTLLVLEESRGSFISEGFSPNGDGLNEVFFVEGVEQYPNNRLTVLNRWGEVVYQRDSYRNDWHGLGSSGKPLPDGNYYYVLDLGTNLPQRSGAVLINR